MAPMLERGDTYRRMKNWAEGGGGSRILLLLALPVVGLVLLMLGRYDIAKTLWPVWTVATAVGVAYLAWQTDYWPGVRDSSLGIEVAKGGAALAVLSIAVKGIVSSGLMHASNFFLIRFGAILVVGGFVGAVLYFWFYLFTTKAKKRTAETMRLLSIAVVGISLWVMYFFQVSDIVLAVVHFLVAIWAGVTESGQAVAEDYVSRQLSN